MAQGAVGAAQDDHGAVDVAGRGNLLGDQVRAGGLHLDDLAEQEAAMSKSWIVIAEQAAGMRDVAGGRRGRVAADDDQLLESADLAYADPVAHSPERGPNRRLKPIMTVGFSLLICCQQASTRVMSTSIGFSQSTAFH